MNKNQSKGLFFKSLLKDILKEEEQNNNLDVPQVTTSEIEDWENRFKQKVFYNVQFGKENEPKEEAMKLYKGESGIEANWSGKITLQENGYITWTFSILNGVFVSANLQLEENTKDIFSKLYEFYKEWNAEWGKILSLPKGEGELGQGEMPNAMATVPSDNLGTMSGAGLAAAPAQTPPAAPLAEDGSYNRSLKRNRDSIIKTQSKRMQILAGLMR